MKDNSLYTESTVNSADSVNLNSEVNLDNNSTPSVNSTLNNIDNSFSLENEVDELKKEENVNNVETLSMNLDENLFNEKPIDNKSDSFADSNDDDSSDDVESLF